MFEALLMYFNFSKPQGIFIFLLSLLLPLSIFVGRRSVRMRRLCIINSLNDKIEYLPEHNQTFVRPAIELIRARYEDGATGGGILAGAKAWAAEIGTYVLPTLIFVLMSASGFALVIGYDQEWLSATKILLRGLHAEQGDELDYSTATALVIGAGFVGAYVWSIQYLILRIANFDLSPLSFLRTTLHILVTVFAAWVLRHVVAAPDFGEGIVLGVLLGIAFLSGLYPSLGLNVLIDRLPNWLKIKREVANRDDIGRSFPLDLIDGIDPSIKFRLNQFEIVDAQNLATANPIALYVETPYDLLAIFDWIAQAQLLIELGPDGYLDARQRRIRDIVAFLELGRTEVGRSILHPLLTDNSSVGEGPLDAKSIDNILQAKHSSIANKLHVRNFNNWRKIVSEILTLTAPPQSQANGLEEPL